MERTSLLLRGFAWIIFRALLKRRANFSPRAVRAEAHARSGWAYSSEAPFLRFVWRAVNNCLFTAPFPAATACDATGTTPLALPHTPHFATHAATPFATTADTRFDMGAIPISGAEEAHAAEIPVAPSNGLQLAAQACCFIYAHLTTHNYWLDRQAPSQDSWHVVAGAIELARLWGIPDALRMMESGDIDELSRATRMRLAVCLAVSFKFQRSAASCFSRSFITMPSTSDAAPATLELAYVGYCFLFDEEQRALGGWTPHNYATLSQMHAELTSLEADMLMCRTLPLFVTLTKNPQVRGEDRLYDLRDRGVLMDHECAGASARLHLLLRLSLVKCYPDGDFLYLLLAKNPHAGGGALAAAAICLHLQADLHSAACTLAFNATETNLASLLLGVHANLHTFDLAQYRFVRLGSGDRY